MRFEKLVSGRALYQTPDCIWVAKGMSFFAIDYQGRRVSSIYHIGSIGERFLAYFRISRQLLRVGIHHLIPLPDGSFFVTAKGRAYVVNKCGKVIGFFDDYQGNKPSHQGVCVTPQGYVFLAEYILNNDRTHEICLYRSKDMGLSFEKVKIFPQGDIRHLHFIKWDEYEKCLWLGTGDYGKDNNECRLYKSKDNGDTWYLIGQGSQDWRAIGLCFSKEAVLWGTDAGSTADVNHLIRMNRFDQRIAVLEDMEGPCHGCASYQDGRVFFSTGVEGGENEKDNAAHLKAYSQGHTSEVLRLKKDRWPLVVQFGVIRFPIGTEQCNRVAFTAMGLKGYGETVMIEKV